MNILGRSLAVASSHKWITGTIVALLIAVFGIGGAFIGAQGGAQASDWSDRNDIIKGGISSHGDITWHYDNNTNGDIRDIFDHYWIQRAPAEGDRVVQGHSNNKGEVIAEGRVVARNASSIGRLEQPGKSHPIQINGRTYHQTTHVGGKAFANPQASLATTVVLDKHGSFKYALINDCGNPVYSPDPVVVPPPEPPKPQPKDIKVCELETKNIITIKEDEFNAEKHSKNLKDCEEKKIKVCELKTKNIVTIKEGEFDSNKHSKDLKDCDEVMIKVCELESKTIIEINEENFDATKHSKDLTDCDEVIIQVCDLETKTIVKINEDRFDPTKHSNNLADCEVKPVKVCEIESRTWVEVPEDQANDPKYSTDPADCEEPVKEEVPVMPTELPQTGTATLLSGGFGLTAITTAAYYYWVSRRGL